MHVLNTLFNNTKILLMSQANFDKYLNYAYIYIKDSVPFPPQKDIEKSIILKHY